MVQAIDRANVNRLLAMPGQGAPGPVAIPANDLGFAVTPEEIAALAQIAAQITSLGKSPGKERYKQIDPQTDQLAAMVGLDIVTGSQQIGVNPGVVAGHISYYLRGRGVTLTPDQVLALAPSTSNPLSTTAIKSYLPYLLAGAGVLFMMKGRK